MNKQITEDFVSFEIAKLLKEKGFDITCRQAYFKDLLVDYTMYGFCDGELIDCPSQSLALKWLREVYHLSIDVFASHYCFEYTIAVLPQGTIIRDIASGFHNTYEQAVEAAILCVLKKLI